MRFLFLSSLPICLSTFFFIGIGYSWAGEADCGSLRNHYGPFDYRTASAETRNIVERVHFTQVVEQLRGGQNWMNPSQDLGYTLNVFPNHHRALMALIKYAKKTNSEHPDGMKTSVACRFERAERFAENDSMVRALHGMYLMQKGEKEAAVRKFDEALELSGDNANIYYNLGLAYFDLKDYDKALSSAHKAYGLGFQLPGLRNKLTKAGKWRDLPAQKTDDDSIGTREPATTAGDASSQK